MLASEVIKRCEDFLSARIFLWRGIVVSANRSLDKGYQRSRGSRYSRKRRQRPLKVVWISDYRQARANLSSFWRSGS